MSHSNEDLSSGRFASASWTSWGYLRIISSSISCRFGASMADISSRKARFKILRREFIARDLLADKSIIRLVGIEGVDHVIAIAPDIRTGLIFLKAFALGVTSQVQPMPGPALAVTRRIEQLVHNSLK